MGIWPCRTSFTDTEGTSYAVEVQAESYYEAVALAVSEFRNDSVTSMPGRHDRVHDFHPAPRHRVPHSPGTGIKVGAGGGLEGRPGRNHPEAEGTETA